MQKKVWITRRFSAGHCTASHCMGLYKEITLKWPIIYTDEVRGRWSKSKTRIAGRKKRFLCSSFKLLALFFFIFFFFLSSKCSSSLDCGSRCCFRWSINRRSAQMCADVALRVLHVLLLTVLNAMLLTTVRCWGVLLVPCTGCYGNKTNKKKLLSLWFFLLYISVCFCFMCTAAAKSKSNNVCVCEFLKHESASAVCVFGNSQRVETSTRSE